MSKSKDNPLDYSDFSHLDEETDTDGRTNSEFVQQDVDLDIIQPHLSLPPPPSTGHRRNPRERGVVSIVDEESRDGDISRRSVEETPTQNENNQTQTFDHNSNHVANNQLNHADDDNSPHASVSADVTNQSNGSVGGDTSVQTSSANPIQICYSKNTGNISVREGQQVVSTREDGTRYIATQQIPQQWDETERRPLRKKRIRWIKVFSIIACVLFFPTGIPAAYFAFRIEKEFEEGILRGNIDRAQKFATRSERLVILSIVLCIIVALLIVTLIERPNFEGNHHYRGTVTG